MATSGTLKKFKLKVHQSNFSEESLVLNAKDFPEVREDDVVKIYSCDTDPSNYLVIKVKSLKKEGELQKDTISIEQTIANRFCLHAFQSVYVIKVDPVDISLDMLEVTFKDQYISRSDMWRLKRHLVGSCTCLDEKVEFSDIRAQVNELWINSNKVKCGLITDDTRIVLRSASALVYIFIQMSEEMWDFDAYGQLQFERAVNGFLKDLFMKWKEKCYHEFTLVLFSRTFYQAADISEFSQEVREIVQKDYRNRFYIDFYKCVAHSEHSEDCTPLLFVLKKLFNDYKRMTKISGCPPGSNSSAAEGNFLEAINMSLNMFEKHFIDRNFDRTGQLVMCVTPGVGVFDVNRDLTVLTKERMIDNGIGSDLVCLGQQPLHAVPLFKFHHKDKFDFASNTKFKWRRHDFNIPHWINHSFYSSNPFLDKGTTGIKYVPRIHLSKRKPARSRKDQTPGSNKKVLQNGIFLEANYEEFDKEIFSLPCTASKQSIPTSATKSRHGTPRRSTSIEIKRAARIRTISDEWRQQSVSPDDYMSKLKQTNPLHIPVRRDFARIRNVTGAPSSVGAAANLEKYLSIEEEGNPTTELVMGSAHSLHATTKKPNISRRALINPFVASYTLTPLTSNRRRWVHTYPRGPQGEVIMHHYRQSHKPRKISERISERTSESSDNLEDEDVVDNSPQTSSRISGSLNMKSGTRSLVGSVNSSEMSNNSLELESGSPGSVLTDTTPPGISFPESPGVDWKSLRSPACLPITNDYFPSKVRLQNEYVELSYNLIPDDHDQQYDSRCSSEQGGWQAQSPHHVSPREIFLELVNQRLCQGFQLVVPERWGRRRRHYNSTTSFSGRISPSPGCADVSFMSAGSTSPVYSQTSMFPSDLGEIYMLNHGRQYHVVTLSGENEILVKIYKPRHAFHTAMIDYKYLLWAVSRDRFRSAKVKFAHEQYESYYWNYQDNYVCCGGEDNDFKLLDSIKYWRSKFIVIPSPGAKLRSQKLESELALKEGREIRFDIFTQDTEATGSNIEDNFPQTLDGFIRFLECINKIRRPMANSQTARRPLRFKQIAPPTSRTGVSLPSGVEFAPRTPNATGIPPNQSTPTPPPRTSTPESGRSTPVRGEAIKSHCSPPNISGKPSTQNIDVKQPVAVRANDVASNISSLPLGETEQSLANSLTSRTKSLTHQSDFKDIIDALKDKRNENFFLPPQRGLRGNCFLSIEGVQWCMMNVNGVEAIEDACQLFQRMCNARYVCHASGDYNHPFIYGLYIYYITNESEQDNDLNDPLSHQYEGIQSENMRCFGLHWLEVEIKNEEEKEPIPTEPVPVRLRPKSALSSLLEKDSSSKKKKANEDMKTVLIPMTNKHKTARTEWCQVQYSSLVTAWHESIVFSFNLQWMVATATCLFEMLQSWSRESTRCNMFMLPTPSNPFAFPHFEKDASPLHCPLFVHVNFQKIYDEIPNFRELHQKGMECRKIIIDFMEAIAIRFGFVRYFDNHDSEAERSRNNSGTSQQIFANSNSRQYIHYSGQVFLKIPITDQLQVQGHSLTEKQQTDNSSRDSPREVKGQSSESHLISPQKRKRHRSGFTVEENESEDTGTGVVKSESVQENKTEIHSADLDTAGFYFAANQMLTKRWRTSALDDCPAAKLENDFIDFCHANDDRLLHFYNTTIS